MKKHFKKDDSDDDFSCREVNIAALLVKRNILLCLFYKIHPLYWIIHPNVRQPQSWFHRNCNIISMGLIMFPGQPICSNWWKMYKVKTDNAIPAIVHTMWVSVATFSSRHTDFKINHCQITLYLHQNANILFIHNPSKQENKRKHRKV